ncbi:MAG TPA: hypothetical protein VFK54_09665 [Candidatus Limnocylindrales bacterium]|nr:hypothetical protein [Candidatus Limnocylindrales bacterium]
MTHTECPVCDGTIRLEDELAATRCEACGTTLELAVDEAPTPVLARAA